MAPDDVSLTPQQKAVLTLMCEGATDSRVAEQLGIGIRTVQRRIAEVAVAFGVSSRPALAARAVLAGVVTPFADRDVEGDPVAEKRRSGSSIPREG